MANRWCIPKIKAPDGEVPAYRNAITDHVGVQFVGTTVPLGDPPDPLWAISLVDETFATELEATPDPDILLLPARDLTAALSTWTTEEQLALTGWLDTLGITDRNFSTAMSLAAILNDLGQRVNPNFNAVAFDVNTIPI